MYAARPPCVDCYFLVALLFPLPICGYPLFSPPLPPTSYVAAHAATEQL